MVCNGYVAGRIAASRGLATFSNLEMQHSPKIFCIFLQKVLAKNTFEHIVRIQFNALMMTVIKCTVKNRNRQFARRSKREVLFCELSDTKNVECVTKDNYSCDYISFEVLNFTIQISNEKLAVALYKLSNKERDVILLRYFQSMSDQEIAELYHVSRSAIYRRRSNGLKKLKTVLKERN